MINNNFWLLKISIPLAIIIIALQYPLNSYLWIYYKIKHILKESTVAKIVKFFTVFQLKICKYNFIRNQILSTQKKIFENFTHVDYNFSGHAYKSAKKSRNLSLTLIFEE